MNRAVALVQDAFDRVHEAVPALLEGLSLDQLTWRPDGEANSISWLVWHLLRVEDDHLAGVGGTEQAWLAEGFHERSGLPFAPQVHGYGQSSQEVGQVRLDAEFLTAYAAAVAARTRVVLASLTEADLDRVVDDSWDPPVTAAVRLVSVVGDTTSHVGQAEYVRGLLERR